MKNLRLIYTIVLITTGTFLSGCILGISSSAVVQLQLAQYQISLFSAIVNLGGLLGSLVAGQMLDIRGRKGSFIFSCVPAIVGFIFMYFARRVNSESNSIVIFFLIFGRFLTGFSCGIFTAIAVPYLLEITHPDSKYAGLIASLSQLSITFGIMFAYGIGMVVTWYNATFFYLWFSVTVILLVLFTEVADSPKWLISVNKKSEAERNYRLLHGETLYFDMEKIETAPKHMTHYSLKNIFCPWTGVPKYLTRELVTSLILIGLQQVTGINALMFFTESICLSSGSANPALCAFYISAAQFTFTFMAIFVIDKLPRKLILEVTGCIMALAQFCFALSINQPNSGSASMTCLVVFFFGYSFGWGPVPFVLVMELFPAHLRGSVSAAGLGCNWVLSYFITQTFLSMSNTFGISQVFFMYGFMCFLSSVFVAKYVPQPTGKNTVVVSPEPVLLSA